MFRCLLRLRLRLRLSYVDTYYRISSHNISPCMISIHRCLDQRMFGNRRWVYFSGSPWELSCSDSVWESERFPCWRPTGCRCGRQGWELRLLCSLTPVSWQTSLALAGGHHHLHLCTVQFINIEISELFIKHFHGLDGKFPFPLHLHHV